MLQTSNLSVSTFSRIQNRTLEYCLNICFSYIRFQVPLMQTVMKRKKDFLSTFVDNYSVRKVSAHFFVFFHFSVLFLPLLREYFRNLFDFTLDDLNEWKIFQGSAGTFTKWKTGRGESGWVGRRSRGNQCYCSTDESCSRRNPVQAGKSRYVHSREMPGNFNEKWFERGSVNNWTRFMGAITV